LNSIIFACSCVVSIDWIACQCLKTCSNLCFTSVRSHRQFVYVDATHCNDRRQSIGMTSNEEENEEKENIEVLLMNQSFVHQDSDWRIMIRIIMHEIDQSCSIYILFHSFHWMSKSLFVNRMIDLVFCQHSRTIVKCHKWLQKPTKQIINTNWIIILIDFITSTSTVYSILFQW
jgi:hypothetical protein